MTYETEMELMKTVDKIRNYKKGFRFTIDYTKIPTNAKINGLKWVLNKAEDNGLIRCISIGHSFEDLRGESGLFASEETYERL